MRCPRCYTEVPPAALNCVKCGFKTPAGRRKEEPRKETGTLQSPATQGMKVPAPATQKMKTSAVPAAEAVPSLPFMAKLQPFISSVPVLAKIQQIRLNTTVASVLVGILVFGVVVWAYTTIFHICLTCAGFQGNYEGSAVVAGQKASIKVDLVQNGTFVTGAALVLFQEGANSGKQVTFSLFGSDLNGNRIHLATKAGDKNKFVYDAEVSPEGLKGKASLDLKDPDLPVSDLPLTVARK